MAALGPQDQLYIYEITGDARRATAELAVSLGPGYRGLWLEEGSSFLFFSRPAEDDIAAILEAQPGLSLRERHQMTYGQWQAGAGVEPIILEGLAVIPAGAAAPAGPGPVLRLDPGLVFGSGLHPTTHHCLELLLLRAAQAPLGRVLDLGCGTGILACAAALLGAEHVLAVDLNPLCVTTTRDNAELNGLDMDTAEGPAQDFLARPSNLVMANLHWQAQEELLARADELAAKDDLILSGVTRSHIGPLLARLDALGFSRQTRREAQSTWHSVWARRR